MKKENLNEITYNELGKYIAERCEIEFGRWYSNELEDYEYNYKNDWHNKEDEELIEYEIEVTETGERPLLINFYINYTFDEIGDIVDQTYYID